MKQKGVINTSKGSVRDAKRTDLVTIGIVCSDETTDLTTGTGDDTIGTVFVQYYSEGDFSALGIPTTL